MGEFDQQLYGLGLQKVMERYLKHYFDLHGEFLPAEGLYFSFMKEIERSLIETSLKRLNGNQVQVARLLGINRNTLRRKIEALNISVKSLCYET